LNLLCDGGVNGRVSRTRLKLSHLHSNKVIAYGFVPDRLGVALVTELLQQRKLYTSSTWLTEVGVHK